MARDAGWCPRSIPGYKTYRWFCPRCSDRENTYIQMFSGVYGEPQEAGEMAWAKAYIDGYEEVIT
jgi:hypothetical protein